MDDRHLEQLKQINRRLEWLLMIVAVFAGFIVVTGIQYQLKYGWPPF